MDPIEAALAAVESLEPGEKPNYTQIAQAYGVVRSTLTRRHQRISASQDIKAQNQQALHPQQELELLRYMPQISRKKSLEKAGLIDISSDTRWI
jgi:transposase-like protein